MESANYFFSSSRLTPRSAEIGKPCVFALRSLKFPEGKHIHVTMWLDLVDLGAKDDVSLQGLAGPSMNRSALREGSLHPTEGVALAIAMTAVHSGSMLPW